MIAIDSSVAIAAFASWHQNHDQALRILDEDPRLVAHAAVETYSVLTRLPPPHRAEGKVVVEFIQANFPEEFLTLSASDTKAFIEVIDDRRVVGGSVYDALIGYTALRHDAELVSADARAATVYDNVGVRLRLVR